jgi:Zn-dependent alcohol dehydrogenase
MTPEEASSVLEDLDAMKSHLKTMSFCVMQLGAEDTYGEFGDHVVAVFEELCTALRECVDIHGATCRFIRKVAPEAADSSEEATQQ